MNTSSLSSRYLFYPICCGFASGAAALEGIVTECSSEYSKKFVFAAQRFALDSYSRIRTA
jgi:hypothetical protein